MPTDSGATQHRQARLDPVEEAAYRRLLEVARRSSEEVGRQVRATQEMLAALAMAQEVARAQLASDSVEVADGKAEIAERLGGMLARAEREVLVLVPPLHHPPIGRSSLRLSPEDVSVRVVHDGDGPQLPDRLSVHENRGPTVEVRTGADVPTGLCIVDHHTALVGLTGAEERPVTALLVRASGLLLALRAMFESFWSASAPLRATTAHGESALSPEERFILTQLNAGLTDVVIARQLGTSQRTVQRHVRALMDRCGARGRFQLGALAQQQGLLGEPPGRAGARGRHLVPVLTAT